MGAIDGRLGQTDSDAEHETTEGEEREYFLVTAEDAPVFEKAARIGIVRRFDAVIRRRRSPDTGTSGSRIEDDVATTVAVCRFRKSGCKCSIAINTLYKQPCPLAIPTTASSVLY